VTEEFPPSHIGAVGAGNIRQFLVELERPELLACPLLVDKVMDAAFESRNTDLRLSGFLDSHCRG
jgi:hypothetical protein